MPIFHLQIIRVVVPFDLLSSKCHVPKAFEQLAGSAVCSTFVVPDVVLFGARFYYAAK